MNDSEIKNKLAIYSPCDGTVYPITKLDDGVFSAKTLGDGVYIIPKNGDFYSPLKNGKVVLIAETKHAVCFGNDDVSLLMHIGLETTSMEGSPFDVKVNVNDPVDLNKLVTKVDLKSITDKKISTATPLVIDPASKFTGFELVDKLANNPEVKRGELIGYAFAVANEKQPEKPQVTEEAPSDITHYVNAQRKAAEKIYAAVGGGANFSNFTHCMTRLRLTIKNKNTVDGATIKAIPCVKDIHWNADELQVIIGSDVVKVYDEFKDYVSLEGSSTRTLYYSNTGAKLGADKIPWTKKVMKTISTVVFPILPVLMVAAIMKAIYGILAMPQVHVLDDVNAWMQAGHVTNDLGTTIQVPAKPNFISYFLYIIGDMPVLFFGLFFFLSVTKYLKGNMFVATLTALIMSAPIIYSVLAPYSSIVNQMGISGKNVSSWEIFSFPGFKIWNSIEQTYITVNPQPVGMVNMSQNIFVMSASAVFYVYFDKWVKSWMPGSVTILFQNAISVTVTVAAAFTIIGIAMSLVNYIIVIIATLLSSIPYGIGGGFYAMLWQPIVVTGAHIAVALPLSLPLLMGGTSSILLGGQLAALAQCGVGFAIAARTKDMNVRKLALNTAPVAILGITEPIMYGVNLPKGKPFLFGCAGSGIAGFIAGVLGTKLCSTAGGLGILVIPQLIPSDPVKQGINLASNVGFGCLGLASAFVISFLLTFFFYSDFKSVKKQTSSVGNLIKHYQKKALANHAKFNIKGYHDVENNLVQLNKLVDSDESKKLFEKRVNNLSEITRVESILTKLNNQEDKIKASLSKKAAFYTKRNNKEKVTLINKRFQEIDSMYKTKKDPFLKRNEKLNNDAKNIIASMDDLKKKYLILAKQTADEAVNCFNDKKLSALTVNYENAFNAIDIAFDVAEPLPNAFAIVKNKKPVNAQVK